VGINVVPLGEALTTEESLLRGLNPRHCEEGLPTEQCFILSRSDAVDDGPSFGIERPGGPIGERQGLTHQEFAAIMRAGWGVARVNIGEALQPIQTRSVAFYQKDAENWGEHSRAHAMISGHQSFTKGQLRELSRHLTKLAAKAVLKTPAPKTN
jgi:hypothetical protein